jgi:tetratricopeptide (TPR) repeat protein
VSGSNQAWQNRFEDLRDDIARALDKGDLDSAADILGDLAAHTENEDSAELPDELRKYRLRVAQLAETLGEARADAKDRDKAIAAFRQSLDILQKIGAGHDDVNSAMDRAADELCRLYRYRMPARRLLDNFTNAADELDVAPEQMANMKAKFRAQLPADLDQDVSYWHHWSDDGIRVLEDAACAYGHIWRHDVELYLPKLAVIHMELATKLQASSEPADLASAADWVRQADEENRILLRYDEWKYRPQTAETQRIGCNVHFRLRRFEELAGFAEAILESERKQPGVGGTPEQIALVREAVSWAYLQTGREPSAVLVLEDLVEQYRLQAVADPLQGEPNLAGALYHLGFAALADNDESKADEALSEAIRLLRKLATSDGREHGELLSDVLELYATLQSQTGRPDLAIDFADEAERWATKIYRVC